MLCSLVPQTSGFGWCFIRNLIFSWVCSALLLARVAAAADERVGPWNLTELKQAPSMRWVSQSGPIHSLLYAGERYGGHETEVFAFYASPTTLGDIQAQTNPKFPAVVLIHGGGGTAFAEWVWLWAKRGYAAIAMDLSGSRPADPIYDATGVPVRNQSGKPETRTRLSNGGPNQGHPEKFDSIGGDTSDDWPFHAVANVLRAHSLLRSFSEVNPDKTAVTGISWGGYTTSLVASLDDRFQAAVPVYGCGFLHEGESVQKPSIDKLMERREAWVQAYDPSSLLPRCQVPILFVNGTNDIHYPLDSYQKSFDAVSVKSVAARRNSSPTTENPTPVAPNLKLMRIEVNMPHGHQAGWSPREIGIFIDSYCRDGETLPVPGDFKVLDDKIKLQYVSAVPLKSATLHFTTDSGQRSKRMWLSTPADFNAQTVTVPAPPANANTWFIALTDQRDAMVTTPVQFQP